MLLEACFVSFVVRSPSSSYISNAIAASVVNIVLAVAGTILNSFVLFIFWKSPKLRSKLSSFTIMLLCSIDLGAVKVVVVHPLFALKSITMLDSPKCLYIAAYTIAIFFLSGISECILFIVNLERYFARIHPFLHRIHFTKRRFVLTWVFFWFFVVVWIVCCVYFTFLEVVQCSLYHSFHIFCNIRRCREKRYWKETITVTAIRNHTESSWSFYENWRW